MMNAFNKIGQSFKDYGVAIVDSVRNATVDYLSNSDFLSRVIGMENSYEDIMFVVQALGREPISLLGNDYPFIFDHVRRNYKMGTSVINNEYDLPKFTFYKERPTVRFANPYYDPMNLKDRWFPDVSFGITSKMNDMSGNNTLYSYAESNDGYVNNRSVYASDANLGVNFGSVKSFADSLSTSDLLRKTNDNFKNGKYKTLIARFHTNSEDSKSDDDITQTAVSMYGMSHGRNLLAKNPSEAEYGYDNPYCRVWTYHHQYSKLSDAIRPFTAESASSLEEAEYSSEDGNTVGFRTVKNDFGFEGGSARLDKYGVLNYKNGMVNIAPTATIEDYFHEKTDDKVTIKKCMFSIENLAWKTDNIDMKQYDHYGLSAEQKGPFGGRIMWFPPYDLSFNEDVRVNWNDNQFIGRGEKVYTYNNTERVGNLSFVMLIDHPSILDYWTERKKSNEKDGGLGDKDSKENMLLRFFAGCEILKARPQKFEFGSRKLENVDDVPSSNVDKAKEADAAERSFTKKIHCVLYFPNNYSGVDDAPSKKSEVNSIYYLMNGIGAQKYVDENSLDALDIPLTDLKTKCESGNRGYEINGNGISIVTKNLNPDYETIKKSYADTVTAKKKAQYLTDENGVKQYATYGGTTYTLAKIIGSNAMSMNGASHSENLQPKEYKWYKSRWYYRVDNGNALDAPEDKDSYLDTNSYDLNAKGGYKKILEEGQKAIADSFGINKDEENVTLVSFADLFVALEDESLAEEIIGSGNFDKNNVDMIRELKNGVGKRFNIKSIKFEGHASPQGKSSSNAKLSSNRARTFKEWMKEKKFPNVEGASANGNNTGNGGSIKKGENNTLETKLWRSASVIIEYDETDIERAAFSQSLMVENKNGTVMPKNERVEIANGIDSNRINGVSVMGDKDVSWVFVNQKSDEIANQLQEDITKKTYGNADKVSNDNSVNTPNTKSHTVERYDNEGEFFELLEKNNPFMHHMITEKIKYFDPAFHSISPEGFNARLTFLQQCTRQGSTVGSSDSQVGGTAYNLSFGRPPVCVLRLGDFFYTKIIINGINIQYDNPQWDLNPEGIGVMPMFAKVSIQFVFLGGSDLAGPISRLQNAVSFNYYANTSVYDNRAETVEYDNDGSGKEKNFKPYSYPSMIRTNGVAQSTTRLDIADLSEYRKDVVDTSSMLEFKGIKNV